MIRRVLAWLMLVGFILLLLNLFIFGWYKEISVVIYVIIFVIYVLFGLSKGRSLDFTKSVRINPNKDDISNEDDIQNKEGEKTDGD